MLQESTHTIEALPMGAEKFPLIKGSIRFWTWIPTEFTEPLTAQSFSSNCMGIRGTEGLIVGTTGAKMPGSIFEAHGAAAKAQGMKVTRVGARYQLMGKGESTQRKQMMELEDCAEIGALRLELLKSGSRDALKNQLVDALVDLKGGVERVQVQNYTLSELLSERRILIKMLFDSAPHIQVLTGVFDFGFGPCKYLIGKGGLGKVTFGEVF